MSYNSSVSTENFLRERSRNEHIKSWNDMQSSLLCNTTLRNRKFKYYFLNMLLSIDVGPTVSSGTGSDAIATSVRIMQINGEIKKNKKTKIRNTRI